MAKKDLQTRINESIGTDKGTSMVPNFDPPPKNKREKDKAPSLSECLDDSNLIHQMETYVDTYDALSEQIKALEARKKVMRDEIETIMGNCGLESVMVNDYAVSRSTQDRSTLRKDLLLSHGVSMQTISACTEITQIVTIRVTKEKGR